MTEALTDNGITLLQVSVPRYRWSIDFSFTWFVIGIFIAFTESGTCATLQRSIPSPAFSVLDSGVQAVPDTFLLNFDVDLVDQILPIEALYKLALLNSPILKVAQANVEAGQASYKLSKTVIFNNVSPFVNYSNGNQRLGTSGSAGPDFASAINGYRYGISVRIPLDELLGRRNHKRFADANYRSVVARREVEELNLKRELIQVYQDLRTSQRILKLRFRDEQSSAMVFQVAEVEYRQGQIEPREFAQISASYTQTKSVTEIQTGEFLKNFYDLQALVGVPIEDLLISASRAESDTKK